MTDILKALQNKMFPEPAHVMLSEVRNATGYSRREVRYADALVLSTWPSRGIWVAGIEVKTFRNDFLSEIKKPEKSSEIQKYCDYWWMVSLPGVALEHEIPNKWGLIYVEGSKIRVVKKAPELKHKAWDKLFVASILRKFAGERDKLIAEGCEMERIRLKDREDKSGEKDVAISNLKSEIRNLELKLESAKHAEAREHRMQEEFGIGFPHNEWQASHLRRAIAFANVNTGEMRRMASQFKNIHETAESLAVEIENAAKGKFNA